jgi:hypothetical protein
MPARTHLIPVYKGSLAQQNLPMGTSVRDGWRESSRPELLAACRLQRAADHRAARTRHPDAITSTAESRSPQRRCLLEEGVEIGEKSHPPSLAR